MLPPEATCQRLATQDVSISELVRRNQQSRWHGKGQAHAGRAQTDGESVTRRVALGVLTTLLNHCDGEMTTRFLWHSRASIPSRLLVIKGMLTGRACGSAFSFTSARSMRMDFGSSGLGVRSILFDGEAVVASACSRSRIAKLMLLFAVAPATSRRPAMFTELGRPPNMAE